MKYRTRSEILADILSAANGGGISKTKMMYKAFLSHGQLKQLMAYLVESELVEYDAKQQTYKTTSKGIELLQKADQLRAMLVTT